VSASKPRAPLALVDLEAQYERLRPRLHARLDAVLRHGQFILGPEVQELEETLGRFVGGAHAVGVSSGRDALLMALMAAGVGPVDAVFVPAFTFTATAEVAVAVGAVPVFVDIHPRTYTLDPAALAAAVARVRREGALRPRAVIPVDLFGLPADYPAIEAVAAREGLEVIADAAQSFGARLHGTAVGRLAPTTTVSFYPSKPLGAYGDGGCVLTLDKARAEAVRAIRVHGHRDGNPAAERLGMTGRLDTLQAAVLLAKLEVFDDELERRRALAEAYDAALGDTVVTPMRPAGADSAWAHYSVLTDDRDGLRAALAARGVPTRIYYEVPLHLHPAFAAYGEGPGSLPVTEATARRILSLPLHPYLDADTVEHIAAAVREAVQG
jgi:dTDP-4-amino-4,6-dideoxygalactose transaminase